MHSIKPSTPPPLPFLPFPSSEGPLFHLRRAHTHTPNYSTNSPVPPQLPSLPLSQFAFSHCYGGVAKERRYHVMSLLARSQTTPFKPPPTFSGARPPLNKDCVCVCLCRALLVDLAKRKIERSGKLQKQQDEMTHERERTKNERSREGTKNGRQRGLTVSRDDERRSLFDPFSTFDFLCRK